MNIRIQSVHFDATEKLQSFITKKVFKLEKYSEDIIDAEVILKVMKPEVPNNKDASVKINVRNSELYANKVADSFEDAIDQCVEALEKQVMKHKEKIQTK